MMMLWEHREVGYHYILNDGTQRSVIVQTVNGFIMRLN